MPNFNGCGPRACGPCTGRGCGSCGCGVRSCGFGLSSPKNVLASLRAQKESMEEAMKIIEEEIESLEKSD